MKNKTRMAIKHRQQEIIDHLTMSDIDKSKQELEKMKQAALPLIKYLAENHHPHVTAIVTSTSIEILEGLMSCAKIYDFIVD